MSDRSVQQLVSEGEFRKAADCLDLRPHLSTAERVLRASLELYLGDPAAALRHSESLLSEGLDPASRVRALVVSGRSLSRLGQAERGISLLHKAISQAAKLSTSLEAELRAQFVHDLLSLIGIEPAVAELPRLREAALRSANAQALAQFHIAQARIAALRGPIGAAITELEQAGHLLEDHPHADTAWLLQHVRAGIASMDGQVSAAITFAEECLKSARESNARSRIGYALGNLANIAVTAGDFTLARTCLDECLRVLPSSSRARFAVLHTGLHLALLAEDETLAERMIADGLSVTSSSEQTYYQLWFDLHRLKWLARHGGLEHVIQNARASLGPAARLADKELHDRFNLLIAETLAYQGKSKEAAAHLTGTVTFEHDVTPPYLIEFCRVAAIVCAVDDRSMSASFLAAATRLTSSTGLAGLRVDVERTASAIGVTPGPDAAEEAGGVLFSIGLILTLGRHPWALGHELCDFLKRTRMFESACVLEVTPSSRTLVSGFGVLSLDEPSEVVTRFHLGGSRGADYWLYVIAGESKELLCVGLERIVTAAKTLQQTLSPRAPQDWFGSSVTFESGMVVSAERSRELLATTRKLAPSTITVLITGETGTGKELIARALHDCSPRSAKPFIPFNCSAVSRDMLDAQLFGYRKGAFTGAADAFTGVIRAAAGGTLFLDEIGEVALDVQPKLLRFLESGEIHPLGEPRPIAVDVRVVAATNANLEQLVEHGRFREDLFYRLNVVRLEVPPLRERREEIPPLVQHYLDKCSREAHKTGLRIADETMEYLILYKWPGNVRQLANELRRMVALAESNAVLMPEHLSQDIAASRRTISASERYLAPTEFVVRMDQPMSAAMEHLERSMIQYAMKLSSGRVEDAASRLGLSRKGLYLKRQRLAMHDGETPEPSAVSA